MLKQKIKYTTAAVVAIIIFAICAIFPVATANADSFQGSVFLGGTPIGVVVRGEGVIIEGFTCVVSTDGTVCPAKDAGLLPGDYIYRINNNVIKNPMDVSTAIEDLAGVSATVYYERNGDKMKAFVTPAYDIVHKVKKLGMNVKNEIAGVGTLTFVEVRSKRYGGLGHMIYDVKTSKRDIFTNGCLYPCSIVGVVRGEEGKPGELRGTFKRDGSTGSLDTNNFSGIFGDAEDLLFDERPMIALGSKESVRTGKAYIYTTLSGNKPEKYEIEIVKTVKQNSPMDRSMVLHVTDERLLEKTGGIVQGMSGSPIIQNDKLIGAVTHVFINDPTRGYGIYIDWMTESAGLNKQAR